MNNLDVVYWLLALMNLTVMTFNVGNGLADPDVLVDVLRRADADIVGLQELALAQAHAIGTELRELYPHQVLVPEGFSGKGLLSRLPLRQHQPLLLYPGRPDLGASIDVHGTTLGVFIAHPPPPRVRRGRIRFDLEALAQLDRLLEHALERPPSILLGDFNMTGRNPVYAKFAAAGLQDAFAVAGVGRGWTLPLRVGHARVKHGLHGLPLVPVARVDYIWYTTGLRAEAAWIGGDAGSDHLPVLARFALSS
ncbi:MAG: endonuclease/exonuclease/phosphatase family protein [Chloroflexi bacterium]|nr:endonuclease/exonuclease/phosphatase family protein [Chloroflexota bacterium]